MSNDDTERREEIRQRDEAARDRDEQSRTRDELSRDRDAFSQRATKAARNVQTWATVVVIVMVAGLFYGMDQRADAINSLQESATRIETAAVNTERILVETREASSSPEAQEYQQQVRAAVREIREIKILLCEAVDHELCEEG